MKRIKQVFTSSSQVFHLWANQSQQSARQAGAQTRDGSTIYSRAFFEGNSAYSYGHHYEVGRIMEYNGVKLAIVNNTGDSNTTSKHINEAYDALENLMPRLKASTFNVFDALLENQDQLINRLMNQLNRRSFYYEAKFLGQYDLKDLKEFNDLCQLLGHKQLQLHVDDELEQVVNAYIKSCVARTKFLDASKQERLIVKNAKDLEAWKQGGPAFQFLRNIRPMIVRVKDQVVQTSSGAEVPLSDALKLLSKLETGKLKKGEKIGSFEFTSCKNNVLTIGCHTFDLKNVKETLNTKGIQFDKQMKLVLGGKS